MPIPKSPDYEFWSADAAAFDRGGLYYQYTEKLETKSDVLSRSIVHFIPQKGLRDLFSGG